MIGSNQLPESLENVNYQMDLLQMIDSISKQKANKAIELNLASNWPNPNINLCNMFGQ